MITFQHNSSLKSGRPCISAAGCVLRIVGNSVNLMISETDGSDRSHQWLSHSFVNTILLFFLQY